MVSRLHILDLNKLTMSESSLTVSIQYFDVSTPRTAQASRGRGSRSIWNGCTVHRRSTGLYR
jgi:hypothetical protein